VEMDDTDRKLLILLAANPRMSIQEMATELRVSRQVAHRRMRALTESGVIQGMTAGISFACLDAVPVIVFGKSSARSAERLLDVLGESEYTRRVVVAGGNYVYVVGELRDISELDAYAEFVTRAAEMPEPAVGLPNLEDSLSARYKADGVSTRRLKYRELSPLEMEIISCLKDDARRPTKEIADMVGASARTVRRHLESMVSDGLLEMHAFIDSPSGGDTLLLLHVNVRPGSDKMKVGRRLLSKHFRPDAYARTFSNIPGLLVIAFWSKEMSEIRRLSRDVEEDQDVQGMMLNFVYLERVYNTTWRDKLADIRKRAPARARTGRGTPPGAE
jgi:DNA-binding Lrp family transcriptional regulator